MTISFDPTLRRRGRALARNRGTVNCKKLVYKNSTQNAPKCTIFHSEVTKFSGDQTPPQWEGETPHHTPRRLWRLDPRAFNWRLTVASPVRHPRSATGRHA